MTKAFGLEKETPTMLRTQRFSLVAEGNVVTHYFSSEKESSNTWAPVMVAAL
jgi:peroxiredoxin